MANILLAIIGWDPKSWDQRFRAAAPQHDIRLWPERVGDPPAAQMFTRADIGRFGARTISDAIVAFDDEAAAAAPAEFDGCRETNRARPSDEDVDPFEGAVHRDCRPPTPIGRFPS